MSAADIAFVFALACLLLAVWCARKALEMMRAAAFWQQEAGRNAEDAGKWRMSRAARVRRDQRVQSKQHEKIMRVAADMEASH